jgi:hypothetical protein
MVTIFLWSEMRLTIENIPVTTMNYTFIQEFRSFAIRHMDLNT